jgi:TolA-binding protein
VAPAIWLAATVGPVDAAVTPSDRLWTVGVQAFEDGLYDVAFRELGQLARVAPSDPRLGDAALLRGKAAFALGRYAEALAEFQAAERLPLRVFTPGEPVFWAAEVLFRMRRFADARERYSAFVRAEPTSPYADDALYARGFSELDLGLPDEALATFMTLLAQYPTSELAGSATYAAARELVRAKRWDDAVGLLGPYASGFPQSPFLPEARYLLGVAQVEAGQADDGARSLAAFLSAHPSHELAPTARALVAEAHAKAGRLKEAVDEYRTLIKAAPTSPLVPQALYQIGDLSQQLGRASDAEAAWKALRRDHAGDALANLAGLELAASYLRRRQFEPALEVARAVAEARGKERVEALLLVGESALKAGKVPDADTAYTAALGEAGDATPERFRALAGVGLVAESRKTADAARRAYQEIVDKADDPELVKWARGRLEGLEERPKKPETAKPAPPAGGRPKPRAKDKPS